jgi:hypothetical protein
MTGEFGMTEIMTPETFVYILARADIATIRFAATQNINVKHGGQVITRSGRRDLNPRPLEPHSSALPSCATARFEALNICANSGGWPQTNPVFIFGNSSVLYLGTRGLTLPAG